MAASTVDGLSLLRCGAEDSEYVHARLIEYNTNYMTDDERLRYCLKDDSGPIMGGVVATKNHECMAVDFLWVDASIRGKGYGTRLLSLVEAAARDEDCVVIWLSTFGFQAPEFYVKLGYELFGVLEKCVNGYTQYFFRKDPGTTATSSGNSPPRSSH